MAWTPKPPVKVATAGVNLGLVVFAALNPETPAFMWLAGAVWAVHATFALIGLALATRKGEPLLWAVQILFVGTLSLWHLASLPDQAETT